MLKHCCSGWLLLADMYINTSKYDQAEELLKLCLQHNAVRGRHNSQNYLNNMKFVKIIFASLLIVGCTDLQNNEIDSRVEENPGGGIGTIDPTEGLASAYKDLASYENQTNVYSLYEHTSDELIPPNHLFHRVRRRSSSA